VSVSQSDCLSVTRLRCTKTAIRVEVLFEVETLGDPRFNRPSGSPELPTAMGRGMGQILLIVNYRIGPQKFSGVHNNSKRQEVLENTGVTWFCCLQPSGNEDGKTTTTKNNCSHSMHSSLNYSGHLKVKVELIPLI